MGIIETKTTTKQKCKFSSRPSQERQSPSTLNSQTLLKTSKPRSRTRKVFPQISKDLSSLVSSLKMEELSRTTTSRRNQHFTWSSAYVVVCKYSSKPSLVRRSPLTSSNQTLLRTLRPKSRTRKEFPQTSKDLSSLVSNSKTVEPCKTITSRRNQPFTWFSACAVASDNVPL